MGNFFIVKPKPAVNLVLDPSNEGRGRTGGSVGAWTFSGATTAVGNGWRGIYGIETSGIAGNRYAWQDVSITPNQQYTASVYCYWVSGTAPTFTVWEGGGTTVTIGQKIATAQGVWQRITITFTRNVSSVRLGLRGYNTEGIAWWDAVQLEEGAVATSYIDGDEPGCRWSGTRFLSTSVRGNTRLGGERIAIDNGTTIGCSMAIGLGAPDVETIYEGNTAKPGGSFKLTRDNQRTIALKIWAKVATGGGLQDLHAIRSTLTELMQPGATPTNPEPFLLVYAGNTKEVVARCHYLGGLEGGFSEDSYENITITLVSDDPYWEEEREICAPLDLSSVANTHYLHVLQNGVWGALGSVPNGQILDVAISPLNGRVYICGFFTLINGVSCNYVAYFDGTDWQSLSVTGGDACTAINVLYNGNPYVAHIASGVTTIRYHNGTSWVALGATLAGDVNQIEFYGSYPVVRGSFTGKVARWTGSAWDLPNTALSHTSVASIVVDHDTDKVYVGGELSGVARVEVWDTTNETTTNITGLLTEVIDVNALLIFGGLLWAGTTPGATGVSLLYYYNGEQWQAAPNMVNEASGGVSTIAITDMAEVNGQIAFIYLDTPYFYNGLHRYKMPMHINNGYKIFVNKYGDIFILALTNSQKEIGTSQIVDSESTVAVVPYLQTAAWTNSGVVSNVWNMTTGAKLNSNTTLQHKDEVLLDPETGIFYSLFYGAYDTFLSGSSVGGFYLEKGDNIILAFSQASTQSLYMLWKPRHWSADQ